MDSHKIRKSVIIFLVTVEIMCVFLMFKSYNNIPVKKEVTINKGNADNRIKKKQFAMWKRTSSESNNYEEITIIPEGYYKLNTERTNCVDLNGDAVNYMPTYSDGKVTVTSGTTIFCWLYFDNYFDGEGTPESPYQIKIIENLVDLSILTNEGNTFDSESFVLTRNLDFNSASSYGNSTRVDYEDINEDGTTEGLLTELIKTTGIGFTPIGVNKDILFQGNFDGANYKISNMYINSNRTSDYRDGLFGNVGGSTITNLTVSGAIISSGNSDAGGIIGGTYGGTSGITIVTNLTNEVNISKSTDRKSTLLNSSH